MSLPQNAQILLVEDNPVDVLLIKKGFEEAGFNFSLHVSEDGEQAVDFLHRECDSDSVDAPETDTCPDLILLDLNLPKKSGKEVLNEIRGHQSTSHIPVIILTTSAAETDILDCYADRANCYITKPVDVDSFKRALKSIGEFWTETATLPNKK